MMKKALYVTMLFSFISAVLLSCNTDTNITIALIGDSTVTDEAGWGKAFASKLKENVKILNYAVGGSSSKSWYEKNILPDVLKARPDYVLIQFGHNDVPGKGAHRETDPATTYRDYLRLYIKEFREIGAKPIIVSPVTPREFDKNNKITSTLIPWSEAAKAVAIELKVPFIDLHTASTNYHNMVGQNVSRTYEFKEGDKIHLNKKGAAAITKLIIIELRTIAPELAAYLR